MKNYKNEQVFLIVAMLLAGVLQAQQTYQKTTKLMGSRFDISVVANEETQGNSFIAKAIEELIRIEKIISSWGPDSQTSAINRNAGIQEVKVDKELFDLIDRSIKISKLTDGAFDIRFASLDKVWNFDGSMTEKPSVEALAKSVEKIGYENIILNNEKHTVFLKKKG